MTLSSLIDEFIDARTIRLSTHTIAGYRLALARLAAALGPETPLEQIDHRAIRSALSGLPGGKKAKYNAHIAFSAFWTWLVREGYAVDNLMRRVDKPIPDKKVVVPLERDEMARLMTAARAGRYPLRDLALLRVMLDTGARASEICGIRLADVKGSQITLNGKGAKQRRVPLSDATRAALDLYLEYRAEPKPEAPLFLSDRGRPLTRSGLLELIERLGERAGVADVHPHRLRHTFAINYLMNGGDAYTLQAILGHTTMEMVKRYLRITDHDVAAKHREASPVKNWKI